MCGTRFVEEEEEEEEDDDDDDASERSMVGICPS